MDWKCSKSASKQYHKPDHSEDGMTELFTKIKYLQTDHKMMYGNFPQMSCNQWIQYMYVSSHHFFTEVAGGFFCLFSEIFLITCKGNGRNNDRTDRESNLGPLNI